MRERAANVLRLLGCLLGVFAAASVLCALSFRTPLFAGIRVFFYRGIALILAWGVVAAAVLALLKLVPALRRAITVRDVLLLLCAFWSVNIVFFTHLPVTADRSISVFMLGVLAEDPQASYTKADLERIFEETYVGAYGAFDKRLDEQIATGDVARTADGRYRITTQGSRLIDLYGAIADLYGIDPRLVRPVLSGAPTPSPGP